MASQPSILHTSNSTVEDLRKQFIRLLQSNGEPSRGNILVFPQVFLEFLNYDHKMAIFLNKLLYWTERSQNPQKWVYKSYQDWFDELGFKESVIRRLIYGDKNAQTRKRTLSEIGVEVRVKRAPNGSPTCHYRINLDIFLDAIHSFTSQNPQDCSQSDGGNFPTSIPGNPQDGSCGSQAVDPKQSTATSDQEIPTQISSEVTSTRSSCALTRPDDDMSILTAYEKRFGKLKNTYRVQLQQTLEHLGAERVGQVLERCSTRGRSWAYVLKALENERESVPVQASATLDDWTSALAVAERAISPTFHTTANTIQPVSERIQLPLNESASSVQGLWNAAYQQLELQLDRATFITYLRDATLVDFEPATNCFVIAVATIASRDMLKHRLQRTILRILCDVAGQEVKTQFVMVEEWKPTRSEQIA